MINTLVYTYWTNKGSNFLCGFPSEESFLAIALKSIGKAKQYFQTVKVYGDAEGVAYLQTKVTGVEFVVVDYDAYEWNKSYWNFPKLITYFLQEERFLHIDLDLVLEEEPTELNATLLCESIRGLNLLSENYSFLPGPIKDNYTCNNICSGLLGGDPEIFKKLFLVSSQIVKAPVQTVTYVKIFGIEEIVLSSLCEINNIRPVTITSKIDHKQGAKTKQDLTYTELTIEQLTL